MRLRASVTVFASLATIGVVVALATAAPAPAPPAANAAVQLEGLSIAVVSVRTWTAFDGKIPVVKAGERWVSGAMKLQVVTDPLVGGSRILAGKRRVSQGADAYELTVESFARAGAPKAAGRFWEVAVALTNSGAQPTTVGMLDGASKTLDARLLPAAGAPLSPRAFLIPGIGAAKTSLVKSFDGKLTVALAPGAKTWALLVFDMPAGQSQAQLQLKKGPTIDVRLP